MDICEISCTLKSKLTLVQRKNVTEGLLMPR